MIARAVPIGAPRGGVRTRAYIRPSSRSIVADAASPDTFQHRAPISIQCAMNLSRSRARSL